MLTSVEKDAQNDKDKDKYVIMEFSAKNIASHGIPQIMIRQKTKIPTIYQHDYCVEGYVKFSMKVENANKLEMLNQHTLYDIINGIK